MIEVCEYELECCPYCKSTKIHEEPRLEPETIDQRLRAVMCASCSGTFFIPCED